MDVFDTACRLAAAYRKAVPARPVRPEMGYAQMRSRFVAPLPDTGQPDAAVIGELADLGEAGLMPMTHPRFFGWVVGGSAPVAVAADWLVSAWGQNAANHMACPTAAVVEEVAAGWLLELLDLPRGSAVGFVSGATMASFTALAAARGALLRKAGWDINADGLFGAPMIQVFAGEDAHASVFSVLRHLGLGTRQVVRIKTDAEGRMSVPALAKACTARAGPKLIIAQAGQINTGAFDPFKEISQIAKAHDAWLHVDGAFGLWARTAPKLKQMTKGVEAADSWAVDGHKWLQVPFDAGYAIVRDPAKLKAAMSLRASYLPEGENCDRNPGDLVPELSRRARGVPTWAALKAMGRAGVGALVARHCAIAASMAEDLRRIDGIEVANDVVLNQIVLRFGSDHDSPETRDVLTEAVIAEVQRAGAIFAGGTIWQGARMMRLSVICGATREADAALAVGAIRSAWHRVKATHLPPG